MKERWMETFYSSPNKRVYRSFECFMIRQRQRFVRWLSDVYQKGVFKKNYEYRSRGIKITVFCPFPNVTDFRLLIWNQLK